MRYSLASLIFVLSTTAAFAQLAARIATEAYVAPLRGPLLVTGTFGELRSDHYHAGLDFRASTSTPVYAVREGFVSRIIVSPGGYGQAIYVDHPDGYRSVYGHLETLVGELLDTVRAAQFAEESFRQDLKFDSLAFPVARGQRIGAVGNRGHSFGSHLHFELREILGDVPVNPLQFGFSIPDRRAPQIRSLRIYELDGRGHEITATTHKSGSKDTIFVRTPDVGVAVKAYDRQDAMPNWNGIYSATVFVDSVRQSGIEHARIPFGDTRYLNAQTDYREWQKETSWFHRLWALPRVPGLRGSAMNDGPALKLVTNRPTNVVIEVRDYAGNVTTEKATLVYRPGDEPEFTQPHQYFIPAGEESLIEREGFSLYFPENALYEDLYLRFTVLPDDSADRYSATYLVHDALTPLHGRAKISIRPTKPVPDGLRERVYLGRCDEKGQYHSHGGKWTEAGSLETTLGSFGDYALFLDTIPPTVRINSFPRNLNRYAGFSVLITDDVSGGGLAYRGTIDGKWIFLEYDEKNDKLTHNFSEGALRPGKHTFELELTDARGNTTNWKRKFTR
ncbi:M23 family metallopeptidase [Neolewinella antarctica]|uniref:M23ase beta-sheet core domain-containing protein n=1 Tax=Neolewinella antarctica TaxID=442734 RepID=A0ABX0XB60_9BACT|nr:M23 family metallopeptidase [Neolewinella antarctica]NJC26073.1 hypothetical protein [Neolewinella antarctica]